MNLFSSWHKQWLSKTYKWVELARTMSLSMVAFALVHLLDARKLDWTVLQQVCSTNPRALLGLPELKIVEGAIAEFTIIDENGSDLTGFASKAHNNPFKGTTSEHRVVGVYVNGQYLGN
jgi:dihydroorotase-like cyclic amidohydrolase